MSAIERYSRPESDGRLQAPYVEPLSPVRLDFVAVRDTLGRGKYTLPKYDRVLTLGCSALDFQFTFPHASHIAEKLQKKFSVEVDPLIAQRSTEYLLGHFATEAEPLPLIEGKSRLLVRNCLGFVAAMAGCPPNMHFAESRVYLEEHTSLVKTPHSAMRRGTTVVMGYERTSRLKEEGGRPSASFHGGVILRKGKSASETTVLQIMATGGQVGLSTLQEMVDDARAIAPTISQDYWHKGARPMPEEIHPYAVRQWGWLASR